MSTRESIKPVASFLFAATLACPAAVLAAPGDGGGGGGGGGSPDYGDLIVLYRDAYGVPILSDADASNRPRNGASGPRRALPAAHRRRRGRHC